MALQGTLDTFALPDVLRLLASTRKSGQLLVQGDQGTGSLYLDGGSIVSGETTLAPTDEGHEVLFELLRLGDGSFLFDPTENAPDPGAPAEVEDVIKQAESAHAEWEDLSTVVPSLDEGIVLAEDLPEDTATVDRDRWQLIVGIGSGTTVRALGDHLQLRELPILRAVRGLVDDGLAVIGGASGSVGKGSSRSAAATSDLPDLADTTEADDLFEGTASEDEDLPEPLPGRGGTSKGAVADPFFEAVDSEAAVDGDSVPLAAEDAAHLEEQIEKLDTHERDIVERAVEAPSIDEANELLEDLPDGSIDRDLLRRFLGSVRA